MGGLRGTMGCSVTAMMMLVMMVAISCTPSWSVVAAVHSDVVNCLPQHVHLSYGDSPDMIAVLWATNGTCDTRLTFGTSPWQLTSWTMGRSVQYTLHNSQGLQLLHKVLLRGLQESTTYFYKPTSNNVGRGPFYFRTPSQGTDWSPQVLVAGDLGAHSELLPELAREALTGQYSAVLQLGGLSSYLHDPTGQKGDMLMSGLEPTAAFLPYMTSPGPGTAEDQFTGYRHRFSMPVFAWPARQDQLWYSFNLGLVHFVSYCTDVYLHGDSQLQNAQYKWLVKDLSEANTQRAQRPWIVAFGYHPMYCSSGQQDTDCAGTSSLVRKGLEDTLYYYGVDLLLHSRAVSYERLYPLFKGVLLSHNYTNPRAPVQITIGSTTATTKTSATTITTTTATRTTVGVSAGGGVDAETRASGVQKAATTVSPTAVSIEGSDDNVRKSDNRTARSSGGGGVGTPVKKVTPTTEATPPPDSLTAFRFLHGTQPTYGHLHIVNATHVHWRLLAGSGAKKTGRSAAGQTGVAEKGAAGVVVEEEEVVLDSLWLVQEHHGKFQLSDLPDTVGHKIDQSLVADGGRPGVLNVHDPEREAKKLLADDVIRRIIIGASFGAVVMVVVVVLVALRLRRRAQRRRGGIRRWDMVDYKYGKAKLHPPSEDSAGQSRAGHHDDDDDDDDDFFQDDHDFEMDMSDGSSMQTKRLLNGK